MKGYVYLDAGGNLEIRDQNYIDSEDPGFFQRNKHLIVLVWKFDTENTGMMYELMSSFQRRQLKQAIVNEFCVKIGFNLKEFLVKNKKPSLVFATSTEK